MNSPKGDSDLVYLWLLVFTLAGPLSHSWDPRVHYAKQWWALFPGIVLTGVYFLVWDHFFTLWGVWGFNPRYLLGITLGVMPLEEYLFFLIVPFSCVFLYEVINYYLPQDPLRPYARVLSAILSLGLFILGATFHNHIYTAVAAFGAATMLAGHVLWPRPYLGRFYLGYLVSLIPFFPVNGILTGSFLDEPVVWYNNAENLGIRLGTIPVEDSIYLILLLLSIITIYEELKMVRPPRLERGTPTMSR